MVDTETWYAHSSRQFGKLLLDAPEMLQDLLRVLPRNRVHLYATTDSLAGQLQHCLGEQFQTLPYPVNTALAELRGRRRRAPSFAGDLRRRGTRGQGRGTLAARRRRVAGRLFCHRSPATRFADQGGRRFARAAAQLTADLAARTDGRAAQSPVVHAAWPLSPPDYLKFLGGSDIGLLMYDALVYHVRCSGVLVEMLSAGVPVVAPAGCWLADQIAEPIFAHQEQLRERLPVLANLTTAQLDWKIAVENPTEPGIIVGVDTPCATFPGAVCQTAVPEHAGYLLLLLERDKPNPWNYYTSISVEQRDSEGRTCERRRDIVGYRDAGGPMTVLVPLAGQSRQIEIRLQTALGHEPLLLRRIDCCFLATSNLSQPARGAVGQVASDAGQVADCLRDIVDHYDHYDKTARAFAAGWAPVHTADQVLCDLSARRRFAGGPARNFPAQDRLLLIARIGEPGGPAVSKFVVLDPTLRGVGHHNFEYDLCLLRAAERRGWQPVLDAHRDLGHEPELLERWQTYRAFRSTLHVPILHKLHRCRRRLAALRRSAGPFAICPPLPIPDRPLALPSGATID